jgi:hypothetical protein
MAPAVAPNPQVVVHSEEEGVQVTVWMVLNLLGLLTIGVGVGFACGHFAGRHFLNRDHPTRKPTRRLQFQDSQPDTRMRERHSVTGNSEHEEQDQAKDQTKRAASFRASDSGIDSDGTKSGVTHEVSNPKLQAAAEKDGLKYSRESGRKPTRELRQGGAPEKVPESDRNLLKALDPKMAAKTPEQHGGDSSDEDFTIHR